MPSNGLPVRKLCTCNAVLCSPEEALSAPDMHLFGVILLNSPANTGVDFGEYVRLYQLYRGSGSPTAPAAAATHTAHARSGDASPYFVCADGAYEKLKEYCAAQMHVDMAEHLCDVLIGDMDSLDAAQLQQVAALSNAAADVIASSPATPPRDSKTFPSTDGKQHEEQEGEGDSSGAMGAVSEPFYFDTVAKIPVPLLEVIRRRRDDGVQRRRAAAAASTEGHHEGAPSQQQNHVVAETPIVLPVACQMSTDFDKCVALLERLRRLENGNTDELYDEASKAAYWLEHQSTDKATEELLAAYAAQAEKSREEVLRQAGDDAKEAERCAALLQDVESPAAVRTVVLPNVLVLGALGGRMDHEMGAMVSLMGNARLFHLIVANAYNAMFACWPDGVTQVLMPPGWRQPACLSTNPAEKALQDAEAVAPHMCGIINLGPLYEMETTGVLWNIVKGRPQTYDGFTQTEQYRFAFDGLISACNTIVSRIATADIRPVQCAAAAAKAAATSLDPTAPSVNPPVAFMIGRPRAP